MKAKISLFALVAMISLSQLGIAQENKVLSTKLQITVLNSLGNPVVGAQVSIYETEDDYLADDNVVGSVVLTDKKGRAIFKGLNPKKYYIYAREGSMDNADGNQSTDNLKQGVKNKVNVVISD